jgi:hypothetical protein
VSVDSEAVSIHSACARERDKGGRASGVVAQKHSSASATPHSTASLAALGHVDCDAAGQKRAEEEEDLAFRNTLATH